MEKSALFDKADPAEFIVQFTGLNAGQRVIQPLSDVTDVATGQLQALILVAELSNRGDYG